MGENTRSEPSRLNIGYLQELTRQELTLFVELASLADEEGFCSPTLKHLGEAVECDSYGAGALTNQLVGKGLITKTNRQNNPIHSERSNLYQVLDRRELVGLTSAVKVKKLKARIEKLLREVNPKDKGKVKILEEMLAKVQNNTDVSQATPTEGKPVQNKIVTPYSKHIATPNVEHLSKLSPSALAYFAEVTRLADVNGICSPSLGTLAKNVGLGGAWKAMRELEIKGFISKTSRQDNMGRIKSNQYQLLRKMPEGKAKPEVEFVSDDTKKLKELKVMLGKLWNDMEIMMMMIENKFDNQLEEIQLFLEREENENF